MNETKKRTPIVRTGIIVLTVVLAALVAELVQRALFGKTYIAVSLAVVLVAGWVAMRRTQ